LVGHACNAEAVGGSACFLATRALNEFVADVEALGGGDRFGRRCDCQLGRPTWLAGSGLAAEWWCAGFHASGRPFCWRISVHQDSNRWVNAEPTGSGLRLQRIRALLEKAMPRGSCDVSVGENQVDTGASTWASVAAKGVWSAPPTGASLTRQGRFASLCDGLSATLDPRASMRPLAGLRAGQGPARGNAAAQPKQATRVIRPGQRTHGNVSRPCPDPPTGD